MKLGHVKLLIILFLLIALLLLLIYLFSPLDMGIWFSALIWVLFASPLLMVICLRKKIPRLFWVGNIAFILLLIGIEVGLRAGPLNYFFSPMNTGRNFNPHEYLFWINSDSDYREKPSSPKYDSGPGFEKLRFNFRTGPVEKEKPPGVIRVMIMGGSNAWGQGIEQYQQTLAGQLELKTAHGFVDKKFEFIIAAGHGYCLFQNLVLYKLILRYLKPDIIVYYGNINENLHITKGPYTYREIFKISTGVDISDLWINQHRLPDKPDTGIFQPLILSGQETLRSVSLYNALVKGISFLRKALFGEKTVGQIYKPVNSAEDYEQNLEDLVTNIRKDKVKLILADPYNFLTSR